MSVVQAACLQPVPANISHCGRPGVGIPPVLTAPGADQLITACVCCGEHLTPAMQEPLEGVPSSSASRAWRSCDLLSTLDRLAEVGLAPQVLRMLDAPSTACPELLLLSLAACSPDWGTLHTQVHALASACQSLSDSDKPEAG